MAHLYIHIPFCARRCGYCDFLTLTDMALKHDYVNALTMEFNLIKGQFLDELKTVYIGGGTPSMLSLSELDSVLNALHKNFGGQFNEFTVEFNPESTTKEKLLLLKEGGVNRISLGMQAAQPKVLNVLERVAMPHQVEAAVEAIKASGINNYNLDLIYGAPHQSVRDVLDSAKAIIDMGASHISAYGLKLEPNVPMQKKVDKKILELPDDDNYADMLDQLIIDLEQRGYMRYEVSNFSLKGKESQHNLAYWLGSDTLGAGLGSVYKNKGYRYKNISDINTYMQCVRSGKLPIDYECTETLTLDDLKREYLMTQFRLSKGIDILTFNQKFNADFERNYKDWIIQFMQAGVLFKQDNCYALTHRGLNTANYILSRLI